MSAPALWKGLARILLAIGGWLLGELVHEGALSVAAILRSGARKIRGKRKRARTERKKNWLMARERRWLRAARWFQAQAERLSKRAVRSLEQYAETQDVPFHSPQETYRPLPVRVKL